MAQIFGPSDSGATFLSRARMVGHGVLDKVLHGGSRAGAMVAHAKAAGQEALDKVALRKYVRAGDLAEVLKLARTHPDETVQHLCEFLTDRSVALATVEMLGRIAEQQVNVSSTVEKVLDAGKSWAANAGMAGPGHIGGDFVYIDALRMMALYDACEKRTVVPALFRAMLSEGNASIRDMIADVLVGLAMEKRLAEKGSEVRRLILVEISRMHQSSEQRIAMQDFFSKLVKELQKAIAYGEISEDED